MEQRKQISFKGQKIFIGLDVHAKSWTATVMTASTAGKTFRQDPDPDALYKYLHHNYPDAEYYSAYEAGFCGFWIHDALEARGIHNIVVNPSDVPTTFGEKVSKTDPVDSRKLARSLRAQELKGIYTPSRENLELRSLTRLKDSITKDMTRQKNRIKSFLKFYGIEVPDVYNSSSRNWTSHYVKWLRSLKGDTPYAEDTLDYMVSQLEHLRSQRLALLRNVRGILRKDAYKRTVEILLSVPGIGQLTSMTLIAEIMDITRFRNSDHLASFVGLVGMTHSSGDHEGNGAITVRKNDFLRASLVEASWKAISEDPALALCYENHCKRMPKQKAIIRIARKLIDRIYFVLKNNTEYVTGVIQ